MSLSSPFLFLNMYLRRSLWANRVLGSSIYVIFDQVPACRDWIPDPFSPLHSCVRNWGCVTFVQVYFLRRLSLPLLALDFYLFSILLLSVLLLLSSPFFRYTFFPCIALVWTGIIVTLSLLIYSLINRLCKPFFNLNSMVVVFSLLVEISYFGIVIGITLGHTMLSNVWPCKVDLVLIMWIRSYIIGVVYFGRLFLLSS